MNIFEPNCISIYCIARYVLYACLYCSTCLSQLSLMTQQINGSLRVLHSFLTLMKAAETHKNQEVELTKHLTVKLIL